MKLEQIPDIGAGPRSTRFSVFGHERWISLVSLVDGSVTVASSLTQLERKLFFQSFRLWFRPA